MKELTRTMAIAYLDQLGDAVDWEGYDLDQILSEVKKGDDYDGMDILGDMFESYGLEVPSKWL